MKNNIKTIIIALGLTIGSCGEDFLEKYNPTQLDAGTFFQTEEQFEQAVNGVYGQLQGYISNHWQFTEYISDNTTLHFNISDRGQGPSLEAIEYFQIVPGTGNISSLYNTIYNRLGNINNTLAKLSEAEINDAAKLNFEGQLKFFRAFYYFDLVRFFGDVIIVTDPIESPDEAYTYSRSPVSEVYNLIESDLNFAVSSLSNPSDITGADIGRVSKGTALSLLGKVYLTNKQYDDAVTTLNQVLSLGYSLMPDYSDVFDPAKKNNSESIFEVQYQADSDLGEWSGFIYNFYPRESYGSVIKYPGANGGGWNIPTRDMINFYEEGDLRKEASLNEGYTNNDGEWVSIPFITKYYHEDSYTVRGRLGNNWPIIRYADVLLMLSEAINEQSGPAEAYSLINPLRERAGLDPLSGLDKDSFREAVLRERRVELAFENHRWFDLKRTMAPSELAAFLNAHGERERSNPTTTRGPVPFSPGDYVFEPFEVVFPIPHDQILINKELTQNPGYK